MEIIKHDWPWDGGLTYSNKPKEIVIHHAAAKVASAEDIDRWHKNREWTGIGYHYYVRKDGTVHAGRPETAIGAHAPGHNSISIGICFEGDYSREVSMPAEQFAAGRALILDIWRRRGALPCLKHSDTKATSCPGKHFPFAAMTIPARKPSKPKPKPAPQKVVYVPVFAKPLKNSWVSRTAPRHHARLWQQKMHDRGWKITVDGRYGPESEAVCRKFQREKDLPVTGVVDKATWNRTWLAPVTK